MKQRKPFYDTRQLPVMLTTVEAGRFLSYTPEAIKKFCQNGTIPAVKIDRKWLIHRDKLLELLGL